MDALSKLCELIRRAPTQLNFSLLEVGALPIDDQAEPFYQLLDEFPGSKITAFEVDDKLCQELNENAKPGVTFYPVALGEKEELRDFYETNHPMCCSLYAPNEELISQYHNLEVAMLKSKGVIQTVSLDHFVLEHHIGLVDFIKIDIQGAELDVFKRGIDVLKNVVGIVTEVEFIPIYKKQPLFGDVDSFLRQNDLMLHKFLGFAGRTLKPVVVNNNVNSATQHMWSDAFYIRNLQLIQDLASAQKLKLGILAFLYGSPDLTFYCLENYDKKMKTDLAQRFLALF